MSLYVRLRNVWNVLKRKKSNRYFAVVTPSWLSGSPAAWGDDPKEQVKHYKHWVFSAVQAISFKVASTPLRLYTRENGELRDIVCV